MLRLNILENFETLKCLKQSVNLSICSSQILQNLLRFYFHILVYVLVTRHTPIFVFTLLIYSQFILIDNQFTMIILYLLLLLLLLLYMFHYSMLSFNIVFVFFIYYIWLCYPCICIVSIVCVTLAYRIFIITYPVYEI